LIGLRCNIYRYIRNKEIILLRGLWDNVIKEIGSVYEEVDLSCMPSEIERLFEMEDDESAIKLWKLSGVMKYYQEFRRTFKQHTTREVKIEDYDDLLAYMIRNSRLKVERTPGLRKALDLLDYYEKSFSERFLVVVCKEKEQLFKDQVVRHRFIEELHLNMMEKIMSFVMRNKELMEVERSFINNFHKLCKMSSMSFFENLSLSERVEIADGEWKSVDLMLRPVSYILFVKLMFNPFLSYEISSRHPYLIARRRNVDELTRIICQNSPDIPTMKQLVSNYSRISQTSTSTLEAKCLTCMEKSSQET
jgi:hypothetical protein